MYLQNSWTTSLKTIFVQQQKKEKITYNHWVIQYPGYPKPYAIKPMTETNFRASGYGAPENIILAKIPVE